MDGDAPTDAAAFVDLFASEYGWTIEYIMAIPMDAVEELVHAILVRRGSKCHRKRLVLDDAHAPLADRLTSIFAHEIDKAD